ncbi:MAG: Asp23/Gls24 family envelope stress response protein [Firmicutes bacterium]|nr:Asp23/Gls24 family envelope stress response protein [Bacillota bacterium]
MKTDITKDINEDKLAFLIRKSAIGMEGVTGMADMPEGLRGGILGRDTVMKDGVKLSRDKEDNAVVDVYIRVEYGIKIPQLAWELQRKIQDDIRSKTTIVLNDINIHVEGVEMGDKND